jgi:hypothetical protein
MPMFGISIDLSDAPGEDFLVDFVGLRGARPRKCVSVAECLEKFWDDHRRPFIGMQGVPVVRALETDNARVDVFDVARAL